MRAQPASARGVRTSRGDIATRTVLNATAGWSTLISGMAGVAMPIQTSPLQAAVTEPVGGYGLVKGA